MDLCTSCSAQLLTMCAELEVPVEYSVSETLDVK